MSPTSFEQSTLFSKHNVQNEAERPRIKILILHPNPPLLFGILLYIQKKEIHLLESHTYMLHSTQNKNQHLNLHFETMGLLLIVFHNVTFG